MFMYTYELAQPEIMVHQRLKHCRSLLPVAIVTMIVFLKTNGGQLRKIIHLTPSTTEECTGFGHEFGQHSRPSTAAGILYEDFLRHSY